MMLRRYKAPPYPRKPDSRPHLTTPSLSFLPTTTVFPVCASCSPKAMPNKGQNRRPKGFMADKKPSSPFKVCMWLLPPQFQFLHKFMSTNHATLSPPHAVPITPLPLHSPTAAAVTAPTTTLVIGHKNEKGQD
ncbi:hypothetical protein O3P69_002731 [Scylla paramamosain]|uniref:Uncharacterized protein n=1 Tax=Scylla paramamosain TaxID=85552 RepID=A0AAW0UQ92_SCYPA